MFRREFICGLIQSSAVLLGVGAWSTHAIAGAVPLPVKNIPPGVDIVQLAQEYLRIVPASRIKAGPVYRLFKSDRNGGFVDEIRATEFLTRSIEADFDQGATRRIGGWIYAETELDLCALHSAVFT